MSPKYPDVEVELVGQDGNAFAIIGAVSKALRRKVDKAASDEYKEAAFSADSYDALLVLTMETVEVV